MTKDSQWWNPDLRLHVVVKECNGIVVAFKLLDGRGYKPGIYRLPIQDFLSRYQLQQELPSKIA